MPLNLLLIIFIGAALLGCAGRQSPEAEPATVSVTPIVQASSNFFALYADRQDIEMLMMHYAENAVLEDMVFGNRLEGKLAIRKFLDWQNPHFVSHEAKVLVLQEQVVKGKQVISRGYFTPFVYHGQALGPWRFVIWQTYDENGLILHQQDWINYTPKEQFIGGENLNVP